jgi:hypothetical protein
LDGVFISSSQLDSTDSEAAADRTELREAILKPAKRKRREVKDLESEVDGWEEILNHLDREARWVYFLEFSNVNVGKIVLGKDAKAEDKEFKLCRSKVLDLMKDWKHRLLEKAEVWLTNSDSDNQN